MELRLIQVREKNPPAYYRQAFTSPASAVALAKKILQDEHQEVALGIALDAKHRYVGHYIVSRGTVSSALVHPREVFKFAIKANASAVVFVHNHPTGNVEPSSEDRLITRKLFEAGELLGIRLLDHVIVGGDSFYSFSQDNALAV